MASSRPVISFASSVACSSSSSRLLYVTAARQAQALTSPPIHSCRRSFSTTLVARSKDNDDDDNPFSRPAPPLLPPKEQREFEEMVRKKANFLQFNSQQQGGDELHPQYRAKPQPDFDGDVNPKTGEVGGPKKDPLTWEKEWSYGGRATDF